LRYPSADIPELNTILAFSAAGKRLSTCTVLLHLDCTLKKPATKPNLILFLTLAESLASLTSLVIVSAVDSFEQPVANSSLLLLFELKSLQTLYVSSGVVVKEEREGGLREAEL